MSSMQSKLSTALSQLDKYEQRISIGQLRRGYQLITSGFDIDHGPVTKTKRIAEDKHLSNIEVTFKDGTVWPTRTEYELRIVGPALRCGSKNTNS